MTLQTKYNIRLRAYERLTQSDRYFNSPLTYKMLRWLDDTAKQLNLNWMV